MWEKLDIDHSGRCDFGELNAFAELRLKDLVEQALSRGQPGLAGLPAWAADETEDVAKAALKLTRTLEQMLFASKSSFVLEDMMRILWPASQLSDILEMRRWCTEMANSLERTATQTPPLLPEDQLDDLHCIFQYFDTDHDGQLKVPDLIATGFLNRNEVDLIMQKYDVDGCWDCRNLRSCCVQLGIVLMRRPLTQHWGTDVAFFMMTIFAVGG